jgi:predicted metal-dependent hydrolase
MNTALQESFRQGIEEFNSERFFEAHEAWEHVWLASAGAEKRHLQGIIQIAAAFHHYQRDNWKGTCSLLKAGLERLRDAPASHAGIPLEPLCRAAREWAQALQQGRDPGKAKLPKIGGLAEAANGLPPGQR